MSKQFDVVSVPRDFHQHVRAVERAAVKIGVWEARGLDTSVAYSELSLAREALYKYASKNLRGRRKDDSDPTFTRF